MNKYFKKVYPLVYIGFPHFSGKSISSGSDEDAWSAYFSSSCATFICFWFILFLAPSLLLGGLWACFFSGWTLHLSSTLSRVCWDHHPTHAHTLTLPLKALLCSAGFLTHNFFCLLVLQFSPSPSPLQVLFICPVSSLHPTWVQNHPLARFKFPCSDHQMFDYG